MWHEARKQERKIRGMLVDYRRRAERRQDFYERIVSRYTFIASCLVYFAAIIFNPPDIPNQKADPTQFMQVHGRKCKIHLDQSVAIAGDSASIMQVNLLPGIIRNYSSNQVRVYRMPWQGQGDNIIDRFDARAHLDYIPPINVTSGETEPLSTEERQANYERYRILAQNEFLGIAEDKFLQQLYLEEQFGVNAQQEADRAANKKAHKAQSASAGAAIGYTYEDSTGTGGEFPYAGSSKYSGNKKTSPSRDEDEDSDSELDVDVILNINVLVSSI